MSQIRKKFSPAELRALLKCCLEVNMEAVRRSGKPWAYLFCTVQKRMARYGNFPARKLHCYRNRYKMSQMSFMEGKLNIREAYSLWGDGRPPDLDGKFIEKSTKNRRMNIGRKEKRALIKYCLEFNVEEIRVSREGKWLALMAKVREKMIQDEFPMRSINSLRQWYMNARKAFYAGTFTVPGAEKLWAPFIAGDKSNCAENNGNESSSEDEGNESSIKDRENEPPFVDKGNESSLEDNNKSDDNDNNESSLEDNNDVQQDHEWFDSKFSDDDAPILATERANLPEVHSLWDNCRSPELNDKIIEKAPKQKPESIQISETRERRVNIGFKEKQALIRYCLEFNVEKIRVSRGKWWALIAKVREKMIQDKFPMRSINSLRLWYINARKAFYAGTFTVPGAEKLWAPHIAGDELNCAEDRGNESSSEDKGSESSLKDNIDVQQGHEWFEPEFHDHDASISAREREKACSICKTSNVGEMKNVLTQSGYGSTYSEILQDCLNIKIFCKDDIKLLICDTCSSFIENLFDFVRKCRQSFMDLNVDILDGIADKDSAHNVQTIDDPFYGFDEVGHESQPVKHEIMPIEIDLKKGENALAYISSDQMGTVQKHKARKRGINITPEERLVLLKYCLEYNIEQIRISNNGTWLALLAKVRKRMIQGGFPVRSVESFRQWYKKSRKDFLAGKLTIPEAEQLWGSPSTGDNSNCDKDQGKESTSEDNNDTKQNRQWFGPEFSNQNGFAQECETTIYETETQEVDSYTSETNDQEYNIEEPLNFEFTDELFHAPTSEFTDTFQILGEHKRGLNIKPEEKQALLKYCLELNIENKWVSGNGTLVDLLSSVQKKMFQKGFPVRSVNFLRLWYVHFRKAFKEGKLTEPEAEKLWGSAITGNNPNVPKDEPTTDDENDNKQHCDRFGLESSDEDSTRFAQEFSGEKMNCGMEAQEEEANISEADDNDCIEEPLNIKFTEGKNCDFTETIQNNGNPRKRGLNIKSEERKALFESCLEFNIEGTRLSGEGSWRHLMKKVQKRMIQRGFPLRPVDSLRQWYQKSLKAFNAGKLSEPEAKKIWGSHIIGDESNYTESEQQELESEDINDTKQEIEALEEPSFASEIVHHDRREGPLNIEFGEKQKGELTKITQQFGNHRKRGSNIKPDERKALLKCCREFNIETIRLSGEGRWRQLLGKVRKRMIERGFPVRSVASLRSWYLKSLKDFNAGKFSIPEAEKLWGSSMADDNSNCAEANQSESTSKNMNDAKQGSVYIGKEFSGNSDSPLFAQEREKIIERTEELERVSNASETEDNKYTEESLSVEFTEEEIREQTRIFTASISKPSRQCDVCGVFIRGGDFSRHLQIHEGNTFACKFCGRVFNRIDYLKRHENLHTKEREFICKHCGRVFYIWKSWKDHETRHTQKSKHKCTECGKEYLSKINLQEHFKFKHLGQCQFTCKQCDFATNVRKRLLHHVRCIHTNLRPFGCPFCDNTTSNDANHYVHFQRHKKSGEATVYQIKCAYCGELFLKDAAFEAHIVKYHPDKSVEL
ncbi:uncharacterized protein LOC129759382 [Uranotaenia lowii]|uniref:uncharacterized protein LOC129759382 n=1 Tax=Uranotaenia lowii TaxID=190385 RepID=UPI0024788812|nr:uncharacterized protein LOC129759382 [Uranotaenia lowii]